MRKTYLFFGVVIIVAIFIIFLIYNFKSQPPSFTSDLSVKLEIHDSSPKSIFIQNDGTVIFTEGEQTNQTKISKEEMELLKQFMLGSNFFSLNEEYEGSGCCDFIPNTIIVTVGNKTHSVYCYNDCPEEFNKIEEKVKSTWPYKIEYYGFA